MSDFGNMSNNAIEIFQKRYALSKDEDWLGCSTRVGHEVARFEKDSKYKDLFSEIIYDMDFIPGGRTLRNAGKISGSMLNCFVLPVDDSIKSIGKWMADSLETWSEGGGLGTNISSLRPEDAPIIGKGGESSGPISFLRAENACAQTIKSGGQRRAAGMGLAEVWHPDILKVIDAKMIDGEFDCFNLSIGVNDDFLEAVEQNTKWDLKFNGKIYDTIPARLIWNKIIENMVNHAEPGLLNMRNLKSNNSYYFDPIISTNPCLTGDSKVTTKRGDVEIKDVTINDEVLTYNIETRELEWENVIFSGKTRENTDIIEIELEDREILKLTPDHKVFTENRGYIKASQLTQEDIILYLE